MTRAAFLVAVMALAPTLPEGCAKALGKNKAPAASASTEPVPPPVATAAASATPPATATAPAGTAPPIWTPPDTNPLPPPEPANADVAKARELAEAGEHKKVRTLLEKKVKAGKGSDEEASLLMDACVALRDKACIESVKAKHPSVN